MTKKDYMKPTMQIVELKHRAQILTGSVDENGMNTQLQGRNKPEDEVDKGW